MRKLLMFSAIALAFAASGLAVAGDFEHGRADFGMFRDHKLKAFSRALFGVVGPLDASSTESIDATTAEARPRALATVAHGLRVRVISAEANLGPNTDMIALWPNDDAPTHLITCNEQGAAQVSVQRVRLMDGKVEDIIKKGMVSCDPVRQTAWGTIIAGEEAGSSGWLLEILNPLQTTDVEFDRVAGTFSGPFAANVATRPAVGRLSWEGIALYPNGVMYYGDENRPSQGTPGGAYYKFIPSSPWTGGAPIGNLADSPLASGQVYGSRLGNRSGNTDYGQGSNTGLGSWVEIANSNNADLRAAAAALKLTGYYRPEDIDIDGKGLAEGKVRFCANNTGNESNDRNWGEAICATDGALAEATANTATPEVQLFVIGTPELAMMDNMAYHPHRGFWVLHEDGDGPEVGRNNDLWACLEDGEDDDSLSDGCIRVATLNDLNAEWTGGVFDASGTRFYVSVQHNVTGHGVILEISGWR